MYSFSLQPDERILKKDHANFEGPTEKLHGALYLTTERLVFVGYLLGFDRKYLRVVPWAELDKVRTGRTFGLIPNVLIVETAEGEELRFIVRGRDAWHKALLAHCPA